MYLYTRQGYSNYDSHFTSLFNGNQLTIILMVSTAYVFIPIKLYSVKERHLYGWVVDVTLYDYYETKTKRHLIFFQCRPSNNLIKTSSLTVIIISGVNCKFAGNANVVTDHADQRPTRASRSGNKLTSHPEARWRMRWRRWYPITREPAGKASISAKILDQFTAFNSVPHLTKYWRFSRLPFVRWPPPQRNESNYEQRWLGPGVGGLFTQTQLVGIIAPVELSGSVRRAGIAAGRDCHERRKGTNHYWLLFSKHATS